MIDIYLLDGDLKAVGIIDSYASLIWANRYAATGDCEIYIPASADMIAAIQKSTYIARRDDDMVCVINKMEITTSSEEGDFITLTGTDSKKFLDQRIIWGTETCGGNVEEFARKLVTDALITPENSDRAILKSNDEPILSLDEISGLTAAASEQVSYISIGEKIREYCAAYGYGYRFRGDMSARILRFGMYAGTDRRHSVIFSNAYDNLVSSDYTEDETNMGNTALIGGQGEGSDRILDIYGGGYGVDRYEQFVDASDLSTEITFGELKSVYPLIADGGTGYIVEESGKYIYRVGTLDVQVMSDDHLAKLRASHPNGSEIYKEGHLYYRMSNAKAATLQSATPADDETCTLTKTVYDVYLLNRGMEALSEYGRIVTFDGVIIPDVTFVYKQDYFLGDIVTIENKYGIRSAARITEMIEVIDTENGYSFEPTFEYIESVKGRPAGANDITTEGGDDILTEMGAKIMIEEE